MDLAYITEFVKELPKGENTEVGENAYSLSGGQKQRVAIARSVLGNPQYYIFDEATSALDNQSERRIQQAMKDLGRDHTLIIIAHRLSTIRHVDNILVFEKGRIIQQGNYEDLASTSGLFGDLVREAE
jgi:ABC-type multidrug transport system fused ATPase/permease subunit